MKQEGPREKYLEVLGQPAMCKHYSQPRRKLILNASPTKLPNMLLPINKHLKQGFIQRGGGGRPGIPPPQRKSPPPPEF